VRATCASAEATDADGAAGDVTIGGA